MPISHDSIRVANQQQLQYWVAPCTGPAAHRNISNNCIGDARSSVMPAACIRLGRSESAVSRHSISYGSVSRARGQWPYQRRRAGERMLGQAARLQVNVVYSFGFFPCNSFLLPFLAIPLLPRRPPPATARDFSQYLFTVLLGRRSN